MVGNLESDKNKKEKRKKKMQIHKNAVYTVPRLNLCLIVSSDARIPATAEDLLLQMLQQLYQPSGRDTLHT